jgi:hypothetical protein
MTLLIIHINESVLALGAYNGTGNFLTKLRGKPLDPSTHFDPASVLVT